MSSERSRNKKSGSSNPRIPKAQRGTLGAATSALRFSRKHRRSAGSARPKFATGHFCLASKRRNELNQPAAGEYSAPLERRSLAAPTAEWIRDSRTRRSDPEYSAPKARTLRFQRDSIRRRRISREISSSRLNNFSSISKLTILIFPRNRRELPGQRDTSASPERSVLAESPRFPLARCVGVGAVAAGFV